MEIQAASERQRAGCRARAARDLPSMGAAQEGGPASRALMDVRDEVCGARRARCVRVRGRAGPATAGRRGGRPHTPPTRTARRVRRRARREGGGAEWALSSSRVLWNRLAQQRSTSPHDLFTLTSSSLCPARSSSSTSRSSCASLFCLVDQTYARADPPSTVQVRHLRLRLVPLRACASTLSLSLCASDSPRASLTRTPAPTRTAASSSRRSSTACSAWSTAGTTLPASRSRATTLWSPSSSRRSARCACSRRRP